LPPPPGEQSAAEGVVREIVAKGAIAVANHDDVVDSGDAMVKMGIDAFGRLDIAVRNAGVMYGAFFADAVQP
jgi:NAD(P)-dependent dehydrogenase (short-subunit alcohol dehydrogenase family)